MTAQVVTEGTWTSKGKGAALGTIWAGEAQAVSEPPGLPCGESDAETDSLPRLSVGGGETSHRPVPRGGEGGKESWP